MIPLFKPAVSREETRAVGRVIRSGWWAQGAEAEKFENEFADYTGARYAVSVSSGTMALKLAGKATGMINGTVVCPALTFISTALALQQLGNTIKFADVNDVNLTMDWYKAKTLLEEAGKDSGPLGVVPVWYAGTVNKLLPTLPACTRVIEDCAHAAGSFEAGTLGIAAAWSFHAVKNLACGDGGMVTTDDEWVAKEVRRLRWCGIDRSTWERDNKRPYGWDYDIKKLDGEKATLSDINAAIGRVQLKHLDKNNAKRRAIADAYAKEFTSIPWLTTPLLPRRNESSHLYVIRVSSRDRFIEHMLAQGVSAGVHYKPLYKYTDRYDRPLFGAQDDLPVTDRVWRTLVTLPMYPDMTQAEQEQVIEAVKSYRAYL